MWRATTRQSKIPFGGGVNLSSVTGDAPAGTLYDCRNWECAPSGGYRPSLGYEPVDGTGLPSEVNFVVIGFTDATVKIMDGDTVTDGGSVSSVALADAVLESGAWDGSGAGYVVVRMTAGGFSASDTLTVTGSGVATVSAVSEEGADLVGDSHSDWTDLAIESKRLSIGAVPGSGPVRGIFRLKGVRYAFRDNAGATACVLHKESTSGWQAVTTPVLLPGGDYKVKVHNFYGASSLVAAYGCDGVNKGFKFDGTTFTQITTGMTVDVPVLVAINRNHLFFAFAGGSLQHSPPGDPVGTWTPVTGAAELGVGDEMVALEMLVGQVLAIWTTSKVYLLSGTSSADWVLSLHSNNVGAQSGTVQVFGETPLFVYGGNLTSLEATQAYGNFTSKSVSKQVDRLLESLLAIGVVGSCVSVGTSQYRLFFANGMALTATSRGDGLEYMLLELPSAPSLLFSDQDETLFGDDNGFVYKADSGKTHNGEDIPSFLRLRYTDFSMPRTRKALRRMELLIEDFGGVNLSLKVGVEAGQFRRYTADITPKTITTRVGDMVWESFLWNDFYWNGDDGNLPESRLVGVATEFSFSFYSPNLPSASQRPTLAGALIDYSPRGYQR